MALRSASGVHCQVAPELLAVLVLGQFLAVDGVDGQAAAVRLDDADDAVAGDGRAALAEVDGDAGGQAAAADIEPGGLALLDVAARGGGLALGGLEAGEHRLQHL